MLTMLFHPFQQFLQGLWRHCTKVGIWVAISLIAACGGGAGDAILSLAPGVGTGGTGIVAGTLTGLGSVIVDGVRYDDSQAALERQADLVQTTTLALSDLQVGQYVYLELDSASTPVRVRLESQLVGPIAGLAASGTRFTVWGQTVAINTNPALGPVTVFSGYTQASDLGTRDPVQVYGVLRPDPNDATRELILATRIERLASTTSLPARLTGTLRTNASGSLLLAGIPLDPAGITNLSKDQSLQPGMVVTVVLPWDASATTVTRLQPLSARLLGQTGTSVERLRLGGAVQLRADGSLSVQGIPVNVSSSTLASIRETLKEGAYITVEGSVNHTTGELLANTIETMPAEGRPLELRGSVTSWVNQNSFMVRGVRINASQAVWSGGTAADVSNGRYIEITGRLLGNVLQAQSAKLQSGMPEKAVLDVTGEVLSVDSGAHSLRLTTPDGNILTVALDAIQGLPKVGDTVRTDGFWKNDVLQARSLDNQTGIVDAAAAAPGGPRR